LRWYRNHGQGEKNVHQLEGRNSRMDDLQAAVLNVKLKYLDEWNSTRRILARFYLEALSDQDLTLPMTPSYSDHNYHLFVIQIRDRDRVKAELAESGIETSIHYPTPLPAMKPYAGLKTPLDQYQVASEICSKALSLPLYWGIEKSQQEYVVEDLIKILGQV